MQKKSRKCTFDFKINAKKGINAKKRQKIHFQFRNTYKKYQKGKKESTFILIFFSFLYPLCIFLHFKPKNSYKKRQKCKKNHKTFSNCKNKHAKKKHEIIFQKKMQKKAEMQKKRCKKSRVYDSYLMIFYALGGNCPEIFAEYSADGIVAQTKWNWNKPLFY